MKMTSEERREARYRRRRAEREGKRRQAVEKYDRFENASNRDALAKAAHEAALGVQYKESVKRYMLNLLVNTGIAARRLENRQDICKGFVCFPVTERGKRRDIMSIHISERVIQKSLNKNVLIPVLSQSLIYDNSAGQKGKGTSFALERMVVQLRRYYRQYGNAGYVLKIDFKSYFGNLDHELVKQMILDHFEDEGVIWLTSRLIDSYYEHFCRVAKKEGQRKGLGLGSEVNQILAIAYPDRIDHYIKEMLRIRCYERYMDDLILVDPRREHLERCLAEIRRMCDELKITINDNKTEITTLAQGFTFLKTRFSVTESGKIVRKPCQDAITRTRRVLKRHRALVEQGLISYEDAATSYASRRANFKTKTARRTVHNLDVLFEELYRDYKKEAAI